MSLPQLRDDQAGWAPPEQFHEYRVVKQLGRGTAGRVYLAQDTLLDRAVAVKFVPVGSNEAYARLLNEARAAARIQHPNVVTLYRVGQLEDRAYIVAEYTRGTSLDRLPKPVPSSKVQRYAVDLARGLAAAHRAGVLHRDLKPGNAVLTEDDVVKLLDFGLAKLLEGERATPAPDKPQGPVPLRGRGDLVGTPYYMSPEAWRGEAHTVRSDIYSLGALLYELCSGRAPFRHVPLPELPEAVESEKPVPLAQLAPGIDPAFAAAIDRCLCADPLARFASVGALLDVLEPSAAPGNAVPEGNPYRGLRPFDAEHRAFFFGRQRDLREIRERLRAEPFMLLAGDSGVGKSSLAAAGLIPEIEAGALGDGRAFRAVRLVPGHHPLGALSMALASTLGLDEVELEATLRSEPESLPRKLRARLGRDRGLLFFIDQLEELCTLAPMPDAQCFALALGSVAEGAPGLRLLATARSDFLTRLAALPRLGQALGRAIHLVRPLDSGELREAIVGPARMKGVQFESEALVQELVGGTERESGGLPLLQFALAELWERRDQAQKQITAASLAELGGVTGALARHADAVIDSLLPEPRKAARAVLLRLVTDDGTRARRTSDELTGGDARHRAALEALIRGRLLVAREVDGSTTYEVAHEALLSGWARLARWITQEGELRNVRRRLELAALEWERLGHRPEALWGPRAMAETASLDLELLAERERRFLEASKAQRARRRRFQFAILGASLGMVALAAGGVQLRATLRRNRAIGEELAAAEAAHRTAEADEAREQSERAQAFAAFDQGKLDEGERAWSSALGTARAADLDLGGVGGHLERATALAGDRSDVVAALCAHLLERAERADAAGNREVRDLLLQRLTGLDVDGKYLRQFRAPGHLVVRAEATAKVQAFRYEERRQDGRLVESPGGVAVVPNRPIALAPGSYLLVREGKPPVRLPVVVGRGESLDVALPAAPPLPPGFVFVPAGRFEYGSNDEESIRQFLNAVPMHLRETGAFGIAREETTWAEYIAYLDALDPSTRAQRLPRQSASADEGAFSLKQVDGTWQLTLQPGTVVLRARAGETLHYPGRTVRADVDWLQLPVTGVSFDDARAYAAWLDSTGRAKGARLCTELEWERAGRGADDREFPDGYSLEPADADIDTTYGRDPKAMGPDPVGSHPASESPFSVDDMTGNVWEWTRSDSKPGTPVARGGSYYYGVSTCRLTNRETPEPSYRDQNVGIRMCVDSSR